MNLVPSAWCSRHADGGAKLIGFGFSTGIAFRRDRNSRTPGVLREVQKP
jgi:hypothetical protein